MTSFKLGGIFFYNLYLYEFFFDDLVLWLCNSILSLKKLSNVTGRVLLKYRNVNKAIETQYTEIIFSEANQVKITFYIYIYQRPRRQKQIDSILLMLDQLALCASIKEKSHIFPTPFLVCGGNGHLLPFALHVHPRAIE